jgi:PTS system galactitol-specific IIC component
METFTSGLATALTAFFSFKAYVILPVFMLILALVARMKIKNAILSTIRIGAGFAGVFVVFTFFVTQISPAIKSIIELRGLNYPVVDVGWPPLAAITWSSALTPMVIPLVMLLNLVMLLTRTTKTLYIDLWNYWHFALIGALIQSVTANVFLALAASLLIALYTIKTTEWSAPFVKREMGLDGIAISPISVSGFLPYAVIMDRVFGAIPGLRKLKWDPSRAKDESKGPHLLREPMVIGILVGLFLSILAGYGVKETLETSVNIAAVMFLLPRCGGLIGEGMAEVSQAFKELMERKFKKMEGLSIAMDTGILMTNPSVIATGLILIPVSVLIAFVLPGNRVIPLGDLPNLISIMSLLTLVMGGNVIRAVLAGIPIVATFMLVASNMAPLFTKLAIAAGMNLGTGAQEITAFTDGGNQLRYWFWWLFQGNVIAIAIIPVVLAMLWFSWRNHKKMTACNDRS